MDSRFLIGCFLLCELCLLEAIMLENFMSQRTSDAVEWRYDTHRGFAQMLELIAWLHDKNGSEGELSRRRMTDDSFDSHGGGFSDDGKVSFGYSSLQGLRNSMEDFVYAKISEVDGQVVGLFGVFDGHAGAEAAKYVKQHLFANLIKHPKFVSDTHVAIEETFKKTDSEYLQAQTNQGHDAGSTASTAILVGDRLLVANVGDSRAVISRAGEAVALSIDHKPNRGDERKRIEEAGGVVMWGGTWRVGGVLALSRAFGDRLLKRYVVADPEIQEEQITNDVEFLVIASDGLWDVISNKDAVSIVQSIEEPMEAAKRLTETAFHKGSVDNISCLVVRFNHGKQ